MGTNSRSKKPDLQYPGILVLPLLKLEVMATVRVVGVVAPLEVGVAILIMVAEEVAKITSEDVLLATEAATTVTLIEVIIFNHLRLSSL